MSRRIFCKVLLVIVAVFSVLILSSVLSAQGRSEDGLQRAIAAQESHTDELMAKPGVVGTAVGLNGNGQHIVMVLLERAGISGIPNRLNGVSVRPVVTGKIHALADPTARFPRPVPTGVSTGHPDITAGTIGCRVTDGSNVYALSNNHVYADENKATIGDAVIQPGTYDGGSSPADDIGTLSDYEPIKFRGNARNKIDAAIALSSTTELDNATPDDGYGVPSKETVQPSIGLPVQKYGRTTGLTIGDVSAVNATVRVRYDSGQAVFSEQIVIEPGGFSLGGDSGSLIVTYDPDNSDEKKPVGLLFAGSSSHTIANPIDLVLNRFGVTVDSSGTTNSPPTADFTYTTSGLTANFTDQSTDSDGTVVSRDWDFGDGATSTEQNPSHTYADDGTYTVTLTVTDDDGATDSTSQAVTVSSSTTNNPPTADFTYTTTDLTADFTDQSTDSDGSVVGWSWDFGDGNTSTSQNPSHTYADDGTYTVTLTVTDDDGATDSTSQDVTVSSNGGANMHVGDLDGVKDVKGRSGNWEVFVTVTIHDDNHNLVANATVTGEWTHATSGTVSGTTGSDGTVTFTTGTMKGGTSVTFTVTNVTHSTLTYDSGANTETSITVYK